PPALRCAVGPEFEAGDVGPDALGELTFADVSVQAGFREPRRQPLGKPARRRTFLGRETTASAADQQQGKRQRADSRSECHRFARSRILSWSVIRPGETQYEFLDRTAMEPFARLREVLERWFSDLPVDRRAELRTRFKSKDERHSLAAFWELYLHASMRAAGYQVEFHPETPEGKGRPDFLVKTKEETFYLEATLVADSNAERSKVLREAKLQAAIDDHITSPNFFLGLMAEIPSGPEPSVTRLK